MCPSNLMSMFHRALMTASMCTLASVAVPAWSAVQIDPQVGHRQDAPPDTASCAWEAGLVESAIKLSKGTISSAQPGGKDTKLTLQVIEFKRSGASKVRYAIRVRADVTEGGKLLATRDFEEEDAHKADQPACPVLSQIGASLGESVAEWVSETRFMTCGEGCTGIHPDETIVMGPEILLGAPDAINETVRVDCQWQTSMVSRLATAYNESEPAPRAKLESRSVDIEKHPGRRLVLRVDEVHALGGGGYTGPKWMYMSGELFDGNALVASFKSRTNSGRGLTTCRSLDSLSDSTADLIVNWLNSPSMNAYLE